MMIIWLLQQLYKQEIKTRPLRYQRPQHGVRKIEFPNLNGHIFNYTWTAKIAYSHSGTYINYFDQYVVI